MSAYFESGAIAALREVAPDPPIIVGEAPSRTSDPTRPLSGRSGARLAELAGIDRLEDVFEVRNLLGRWPGRTGKASEFPLAIARRAARKLERSIEGRLVLLLGRRVARAFDVDEPYLASLMLRLEAVKPIPDPIGRSLRAPNVFLVVPHPSGVNRWWNAPGNEDLARDVLGAIARAYRRT